jgi:hypothetical protein
VESVAHNAKGKQALIRAVFMSQVGRQALESSWSLPLTAPADGEVMDR